MDTKLKQTRRQYSEAFRRQVVAETLDRSESVAAVALRHGLNANLVFKWRRRYAVMTNASATLVPIRVTPAVAKLNQPSTGEAGAQAEPQGHIEIRLAGGHRLSVQGTVDPALMRVVLENLR